MEKKHKERAGGLQENKLVLAVFLASGVIAGWATPQPARELLKVSDLLTDVKDKFSYTYEELLLIINAISEV